MEELNLVALALEASKMTFSGEFTIQELKTKNDNYKIIKPLASGDFADIFLLENEAGKKFVLKLVRDQKDNDLILNEITAINSLPEKEYFPTLIESFKSVDGRLCSIFNYIEGCNLATLIKIFPNGVSNQVFGWMLHRLLTAVGYVHYHKRVHGNLDPANVIWVQGTHDLILIDFVFASKDRYKPIGINPYSAPEIAEGKLYYNSDLYSLALICIFLLGGDIKNKTFPPDTCPELVCFLNKLLVEDRYKRESDAFKIAHQWQDKLREQIIGPIEYVPFNPQI